MDKIKLTQDWLLQVRMGNKDQVYPVMNSRTVAAFCLIDHNYLMDAVRRNCHESCYSEAGDALGPMQELNCAAIHVLQKLYPSRSHNLGIVFDRLMEFFDRNVKRYHEITKAAVHWNIYNEEQKERLTKWFFDHLKN